MVDGSEPYVGDIVDVFQTMEDIFPDAFRGDPLFVGCPLVFELIDHLLDLIVIHASFIECHEDASLHFGPVVEFFLSIGFGHEEVDELQTLKGRESGFAFLALTSTSDRLTILSHSGIDNLSIEVFAFRTAHIESLECRIEKECMDFSVFVKPLENLVFLLYFHPIQIISDNTIVGEIEIGGKVGGADTADPDPVSFLGVSDSSRIGNALEIGDILTDRACREGSVLHAFCTILLIGKGLSGGLAEVPRLDGLSIIGDDLSTGRIYESGAVGTPLFIAIAEILLELIGVIGSIIGFPGKFSVLRFTVKIGVRSRSGENGFDFLFIISIGDFGNPPEVVLKREFVDDDEIPSFIKERDLSTEDIVIHRAGGVPRRLAVPARDSDDIRSELHFGERVFFLPEYESDFIGSECLKGEFRIFLEGSGDISDREPGKGSIPGFQTDAGSGVRETDPDSGSFIQDIHGSDVRTERGDLYGIVVGIDSGGASYRGSFCFSDIFHDSEEIVSRTTRKTYLSVACKVRGREIIDDAPICSALFMSYGSLVDVDSIFFREIFDNPFHCVFLFCHDGICHKIPHDTDSDGAFVIPERVCRDIVVASGATFVDLPALSDEVIVSDITPPSNDCMIIVDSSDESEIVFVSQIVFRGMVDDDPFHLFRLFYRPDERMSVLGGYFLYRLVLFWKIGCKMCCYSSIFCLVCESSVGLRFVFICFQLREYRFPCGTICVAKRFVRPPIGPFDDVGAGILYGGCFRNIRTECHMEAVRVGIEPYDGNSRDPDI